MRPPPEVTAMVLALSALQYKTDNRSVLIFMGLSVVCVIQAAQDIDATRDVCYFKLLSVTTFILYNL